ncbi:MAG: pyrroline-5-carboxylate reductase [Luteitalea sp.]|nr:pyrroline-5-carboxylate reductase [Luteitalea sp.]
MPHADAGISKLAVIGAGKMGGTLIRALVDAAVIEPGQIIATSRHTETAGDGSRRLGVEVITDNRAGIRGADVVIVAVKPQVLAEVLDEIGGLLEPHQLLVSIVASATTAFIERQCAAPVPVVRSMPNTPSLVRAGMSVLCAGSHATRAHLNKAERVFGAVGRTLVLDEKHMDAVTALGASGPAFVYVVLESLAEGGVKVGLPRDIATELAAQTCLGAAKMVLETGEHPALLKDAVTTPAGCTIDGLLALEEGGLRVTLIKAVVEATLRAGQLLTK